MSQQQTKFFELPNEIVCCILDFLTTWDILRAFAHLNNRYDELLRFHIKTIDLSDNKQEFDEQQLKWILTTIQILKVDAFHYHLLKNYSLSQLHTLHIPNIDYNYVTLSKMHLNKLIVISKDNCNYDDHAYIPQTVTHFSTNANFHFNNFHGNLIRMTINVQSMVHLNNIVNNTPNLVHLSVTFAHNFNGASFYTDRLETPNHRLTELTFLSIQTKEVETNELNMRLPFDEIDLFIDQRCPNTTVLKRVVLQFHRINFSNEIWSTILQYRTTYSRFDFYGSFIVDDNKIHWNTEQFNYFIEGVNMYYPKGYFIHVYSLPFVFDKFYGYISCCELSTKTTFSTVRHLCFTYERHSRSISCEHLPELMPNLLSINYHCAFNGFNYDTMTVPETKPIRGIFNYIRSFNFKSQCESDYCICHRLFHQMIERMPYLQILTTSIDPSSSTIEQLQNSLSKYRSILKIQFMNETLRSPNKLSQIVAPLFLNISSLRFIVFPRMTIYEFNSNRTSEEEYIKLVHKMDNRLHNVKIRTKHHGITYYL